MSEFVRFQSFDVFRPSFDRWNNDQLTHMDTVFYQEHVRMTIDEVRNQLIEHDGYPDYIIVRKGKRPSGRE
jgi:hypothetical protein